MRTDDIFNARFNNMLLTLTQDYPVYRATIGLKICTLPAIFRRKFTNSRVEGALPLLKYPFVWKYRFVPTVRGWVKARRSEENFKKKLGEHTASLLSQIALVARPLFRSSSLTESLGQTTVLLLALDAAVWFIVCYSSGTDWHDLQLKGLHLAYDYTSLLRTILITLTNDFNSPTNACFPSV